MKQITGTIVKYSFFILSAIFLLLVVGDSFLNPHSSRDTYNVQKLESGWVYEDGTDVGFPFSITSGAPESTKISYTLPSDFRHSQTLCIHSSQQFLYVYLDGIRIYEYQKPEYRILGKATSSRWNLVDIPEKSHGKTISIEAHSPYQNTKNEINEIIYGSKYDVNAYMYQESLPNQILSWLMLMFGIFLLIADLVTRKSSVREYSIGYLGCFLFLFGIWSNMESRTSFANNIISENVEMMVTCWALMLLPIPFLLYLRNLFPDKTRNFDLLGLLFVANFIFCTTLQLTGIADMVETLFIAHLLIIATALYTLYVNFKYYKHIDGKWYRWLAIICSILLYLSVFLEVIMFYVDGFQHTGIFLRIGIFSYIVNLSAVAIDHIACNIRMQAEMKEQLQRSRIQLMLSQIQPHFLYNTLTVIQELCYTDPQMAADTIVQFSDYLRANMDFLESKELIPYRLELQHIENYMNIQKLCFGDQLIFIEDIQVQEFYLPPLTVQPLVENAVKNGVRKRPGVGTVKLSTLQDGDHYVILIEDDGVGFDMNKPPEDGKFHSMKNVIYRFEHMLNAEIKFDSILGQGTKVTIRIPIVKENQLERCNRR